MSTHPSPVKANLAAVFLALPWCCLLPAGLALVSAVGAVSSRLWLTEQQEIWLAISILPLARALWLTYGRQLGGRLTRGLTWISAVLVLGLWLVRI